MGAVVGFLSRFLRFLFFWWIRRFFDAYHLSTYALQCSWLKSSRDGHDILILIRAFKISESNLERMSVFTSLRILKNLSNAAFEWGAMRQISIIINALLHWSTIPSDLPNLKTFSPKLFLFIEVTGKYLIMYETISMKPSVISHREKSVSRGWSLNFHKSRDSICNAKLSSSASNGNTLQFRTRHMWNRVSSPSFVSAVTSSDDPSRFPNLLSIHERIFWMTEGAQSWIYCFSRATYVIRTPWKVWFSSSSLSKTDYMLGSSNTFSGLAVNFLYQRWYVSLPRLI